MFFEYAKEFIMAVKKRFVGRDEPYLWSPLYFLFWFNHIHIYIILYYIIVYIYRRS